LYLHVTPKILAAVARARTKQIVSTKLRIETSCVKGLISGGDGKVVGAGSRHLTV
jgi:hypothetical protein